MKQAVAVFCVLTFSLLAGCENLPFLKPQKQFKKEEAVAPAPAVKGTVIARVNNMPITLEELNKYVDIYNASIDLRQDLSDEQKKREKIDTREKKIDYLKKVLIRQLVFYQVALDRGLDRKDEIVEMLQNYKVALLSQEMQGEIVKRIDISSAEIENAYNTNKTVFKEPESRRVREIVTRTEEEARQALIELLQGGDFTAIARARSISESRKADGDLGFIKKGQRGEQYAAFDEVAFSTALGQAAVSSVFKVPEGYCIVKIEAIKEGKQVSLSEAWDTIKEILLTARQKDELDKAYSELSLNMRTEIREAEIK